MREASRMGQPCDHMLHMCCTSIQSCMLRFLMLFCLACARPRTLEFINNAFFFKYAMNNKNAI